MTAIHTHEVVPSVCPDQDPLADTYVPTQTEQTEQTPTTIALRSHWNEYGTGFRRYGNTMSRKKADQIYDQLQAGGTFEDPVDDRVVGFRAAMEVIHDDRRAQRVRNGAFIAAYTRILTGLDRRAPGLQLTPQQHLVETGILPNLAVDALRYTKGVEYQQMHIRPGVAMRQDIGVMSPTHRATVITDRSLMWHPDIRADGPDVTVRIPTGQLFATEVEALPQFSRDDLTQTPGYINAQTLHLGYPDNVAIDTENGYVERMLNGAH